MQPLDVALGVGTALWYALPDVVESRRVRGVVKTAVVVGGAGLVAVRAHVRHDPVLDDSDVTEEQPTASMAPGRAAATVAVTSLASIAGTVLLDRCMVATARRLRGHGVRRPYTVMGAGIGAAAIVSRPSQTWRG